MEIIGIIKKNLFEKSYALKDFPFKSFTKNKILIKSGNDEYFLDVPKSKIHLLKICTSNHLIKFTFRKSQENFILENAIILQTIKIDKHPIIINETKYVVQALPSKNAALYVSLLDIEKEQFIEITHYYQFPENKLNGTHAFIKANDYDSYFDVLSRKGILDKGIYIETLEGLKGYACKVLIMHLTNHQGFLPIHDPYSSNFWKVRKHHYIIDLVEEIDYSKFNDNLDLDQQSDEFWNQF